MSFDPEQHCQSELIPLAPHAIAYFSEPEVVDELLRTAFSQAGQPGYKSVCPVEACDRACVVRDDGSDVVSVALFEREGICHGVYTAVRRFLPPGA